MRALVMLSLTFALIANTAFATAERPAFNITESMRTCMADTDCKLVDTDCEDCCQHDAVAIHQLESFAVEKKKFCPKPKAMCDCIGDKTKKPACVDKRCVLQ